METISVFVQKNVYLFPHAQIIHISMKALRIAELFLNAKQTSIGVLVQNNALGYQNVELICALTKIHKNASHLLNAVRISTFRNLVGVAKHFLLVKLGSSLIDKASSAKKLNF